MRLAIIVPISVHEKLPVIQRSVENVMRLDRGELDVRAVYVVDSTSEKDERAEFLRNVKGIEVLQRTPPEGRKARAMNEALDRIGETDYVVFLDVDSRPDRNFLTVCADELRTNKEAFIASGPRYITNAGETRITAIVSAEYKVLADIYRLFNYFGGFAVFNGLVGVVDGSVFRDARFSEEVMCEDYELTQRLYLRGRTAKFTKKTRVGEQAPITLRDLYHQRLRWVTGAVEGLGDLRTVMKSNISKNRKHSWVAIMILPFFIAMFSLLVSLYADKLWKSRSSNRDFLVKYFGLMFHVWLLEVCGIVALIKHLANRRVEWKKIERSNV